MSQRVLIAKKENVTEKDSFYDCIYSEESGYLDLLNEWCCYRDGFYLGPFKIMIRDRELMDQFCEDFKELGQYIPALQSFDDVWGIYDNQGNQIHLSKSEDDKLRPAVQRMIDYINKK